MNNLLKIIFFNFLFFSFVFSEESLNDDDYYKKGVKLYDQGEFKKSFIVFFNLSEKGNKDAIYNLSNMYSEGIGTVQDYNSALKYTWLCSLNGNNKCIKKINKLTEKMDEKEVTEIATNIPKVLTILKSTALNFMWVIVEIMEVGIIIEKDVPKARCII